MSAPPISKDLLEHLQAVFPDKLPAQPSELGQFGILIGQQRVIQHLQAQFKLQNRTVLGGN